MAGKDRELIFKDEAENAIVKNSYYFLDGEGRGIDQKDRGKVAKDILKSVDGIKKRECPVCKGKIFIIDEGRHSYCPCCGGKIDD